MEIDISQPAPVSQSEDASAVAFCAHPERAAAREAILASFETGPAQPRTIMTNKRWQETLRMAAQSINSQAGCTLVSDMTSNKHKK